MSSRRAVGYIVSQVLGAVAGASVILLIASGSIDGYSARISGLGANGYEIHSPGGYSLLSCFVAEMVLTMILVLTVLASTDAKAAGGFAGIAIGFVLTLIHLVGIPITNTSVNPARSIGPAIFVGGWALNQLWLFVVSPIVGAILAASVYRAIHSKGSLEVATSNSDQRKGEIRAA